MILYLLPILVFLPIVYDVGATGDHTPGIHIVTERGNVFVLPYQEEGTQSMVDGFGINNRLVHEEYGGILIHGTGRYGTQDSMQPYNQVGNNVEFAASISSDDSVTQMLIPEFYESYSYDKGALVKKSGNSQGILGHSGYRTMWGNITISSISHEGINISGDGRLIVKLNEYDNTRLAIKGTLSEGTTVRLVISPYDLLSQTYDANHGFVINHCYCDLPEFGLEILAGTADDSVKSARFAYDQTASVDTYIGKCCKNRYTISETTHQETNADLVITSHSSGYFAVAGDNTRPTPMNINDILPPGNKLFRVNHNILNNFEHWVYDTLPVMQLNSFPQDTFESTVVLDSGTKYLVIDSPHGGESTIGGSVISDAKFIDIDGLPQNTVYKLVRDGGALLVGTTADDGRITFDVTHDITFNEIQGKLLLYEDSLTYVRDMTPGAITPQGIIVFDHVNSQVLHLSSPTGDKIYNVHAYVKIPMSGSNVIISDVDLKGVVKLDYLDGLYDGHEAIFVPVIPTYGQVNLKINGTPLLLHIEDVLGGSGIRIADPVSSTVDIYKHDEFTNSISATAGAVTYMIATIDGNAKAHVQATVSGKSEITNTRKFVLPNIPPPPPPTPRDPLTTWVEVYVNGELRHIDGKTKTQIFFSDAPIESHSSGTQNFQSYHTARFTYSSVTITDTISVPVNAADFVEFYFYTRIDAEGSTPPIPLGFEEHKRSSVASATATLRYASINTSM